MNEIVTTGGRPMSRRLESALDSLDALTRRSAIRAYGETAAKDGPLAALYAGLVVELELCLLREEAVLAEFEADHAAEVDAHDVPPPPASTL